MEDIPVPSPGLLHKAVLKYAGEIRFGPTCYSLVVDDLSFGNRVFGKTYLWSPNSRFFAVQEWETTNEGSGPQTRLLLIDIEARRECVLSRAENGFIVPKEFDGDKLIYVKEYFVPRVTKEFEIEFLPLDRWENIK